MKAKNVWILSLVSFFTDMGSYMVTPLIPILLSSSGPIIIGIIDGLSESLSSVLKLYSGIQSDRLKNRKRMAIFGYGLSGIGRLVLIFSSTWIGVFFWKLVDRTGKGIRTAPRDALISESGGKNKQGRAFGIHQMMDMFGASLGIGAAIVIMQMEGSKNIKDVFLYSLIPVSIGWLILFCVKERKKQPEGSSRNELKNVHFSWKLLDSDIKKLLLIVLMFTIVNSSNSFLLLRASNLGVSNQNVLLMFLIFHLTASSLSYVSGAFSDKFGRRGILTTGYALYGVVYIGFAEVHSFIGFITLFILYGLYSALTKGVEKALVVEIAGSNAKGTALGFYAMISGIGLFPASLLTGWLWQQFGASVSFFINGIIAIVAAFMLSMTLRRIQKS